MVKKNKKVVLQIIPEFGLAGAEIMCENLVMGIQGSEEYSVIVVSLYDSQSPITDRLEKNGIPVFYLNKKTGFDLSIIPKIINIIRQEKVNIIHTHLYTMQYAIPAAIFTGIKSCIHTIHNIATEEVSKARRRFAKVLFKKHKVVPVSISPLISESVSQEYSLPLASIPMVYNGIDISKCVLKKEYSINGPFEFVHVGRFSEQKNHKTIIQAFKKLVSAGYNVRLSFIGDGPLIGTYKNEVSSLGLNKYIDFLGLKNNVCSLLHSFDAFLLPSLYEGMPISLIEAMGCGMPIIASDVGGIPDMIIDEESGLLVKPEEESLFNAMEKLMQDQELRQKLGIKACQEANRFTVYEMTKKYIEIYNQISK